MRFFLVVLEVFAEIWLKSDFLKRFHIKYQRHKTIEIPDAAQFRQAKAVFTLRNPDR